MTLSCRWRAYKADIQRVCGLLFHSPPHHQYSNLNYSRLGFFLICFRRLQRTRGGSCGSLRTSPFGHAPVQGHIPLSPDSCSLLPHSRKKSEARKIRHQDSCKSIIYERTNQVVGWRLRQPGEDGLISMQRVGRSGVMTFPGAGNGKQLDAVSLIEGLESSESWRVRHVHLIFRHPWPDTR